VKRVRKPEPELDPASAAIRRLNKAGASSDTAVRRRIALIAAERKLNPSETKPLMSGRSIPLHPLGQFRKKHNLSLDWLLAGDRKGLKQTAEWKTQELLFLLSQKVARFEFENQLFEKIQGLAGRC
jgi:hypothetical protein